MMLRTRIIPSSSIYSGLYATSGMRRMSMLVRKPGISLRQIITPPSIYRRGIGRPMTLRAYSSDSPFSTEQSTNSKPPPLFSIKTFMLAMIPVLTFGLGVWQVQRLSWKLSLIKDLEDKLHRPPLTLPLQIK